MYQSNGALHALNFGVFHAQTGAWCWGDIRHRLPHAAGMEQAIGEGIDRGPQRVGEQNKVNEPDIALP